MKRRSFQWNEQEGPNTENKNRIRVQNRGTAQWVNNNDVFFSEPILQIEFVH